MTKTALELYIYMGSDEPVIKWLKEEGCTTRGQAQDKIAPLVRSNVIDAIRYAGQGSTLAGTTGAVKRILNAFPE